MPLLGVFMPPARIDARGQKTNNQRAAQRFGPGFLHPFADFAAVGRVHENLAAPRLTQAVVFPRKIVRTFRVLRSGAWIEREAAKDAVNLIEESLWRCPFARQAGEMDTAPRRKYSAGIRRDIDESRFLRQG